MAMFITDTAQTSRSRGTLSLDSLCYLSDIISHVGPGVDSFSFDTDKLSMYNCLVKFTPASEDEIQKIVKNSPDKSCELAVEIVFT